MFEAAKGGIRLQVNDPRMDKVNKWEEDDVA